MGLPVSTSSLQKIDRWIGVPVCGILSLARKLFGSKPTREKPRKILFVKFAEQGSTVIAHAALRRAGRMVGRENVYFIVFEENRFILDVLDLVPVENVITIPTGSAVEMAFGALRALRRIQELKIDAAVDLEFFSRSSAALTFLTRARSRAGFHTFFGEGPYRGDLMTHRLLYNPYLHTSQIFEQMVMALEQDPADLPTFGVQPPPVDRNLPLFEARPGEIDEVREMLRSLGRENEPLILLNPNASDLLPLRKWEPVRYVELARRLLVAMPNIRIAMTGAPSEAEPIARLAAEAGSPRCFSVAGKTTLRQLMVLYSLSELLITNDSGPAHFATLTPIHVITLFGPETPSLFAAPTTRNTAIWLGIACSPCVNAYNNRQSPCTNNVCMQQITVERVFAEAMRVMGQRHHV